jgi:hypothetical protein
VFKRLESCVQGIQQEIEIMSDDVCCITKEEIIPTEEDKEIQCQLIGRYSIETFILNPKAIQFYTGFKSFEHFMFLFNCLGPAAYDLNYKWVNLTPISVASKITLVVGNFLWKSDGIHSSTNCLEGQMFKSFNWK